MRVALLEMLHPDAAPGDRPIPPEGAIYEAVETAKTFCGAEAPGFVNGILAAVLREMHENPPGLMTELDTTTLDDLVERLERAAEQLRTGDLSARRRRRPGRGLRRARRRRPRPSSSAWRARRAQEPLPGQDSLLGQPGHAALTARLRRQPHRRTPTRCATRSSATSTALRFTGRAPATAGLEEAMRYSLLAGGKRIRPGARAGDGAAAIGADPRDGPAARRARSSSSTPTRSSTTTCRRWTTTTCAAGGRRATSSSARTSRSSPATRSTPRRSATCSPRQRGRARARPRRRARARRGHRRRRHGRRPVPRRRRAAGRRPTSCARCTR